MAVNLTNLTANVNNIQSLSDKPNETDGLTAQGLKEKFDKAGADIKSFINGTHIPELERKMTSYEAKDTELDGKITKLDTDIKNEIQKIGTVLFPVGSIYTSKNDVNPSTFLGGTWVKKRRYRPYVINGTIIKQITGSSSTIVHVFSEIIQLFKNEYGIDIPVEKGTSQISAFFTNGDGNAIGYHLDSAMIVGYNFYATFNAAFTSPTRVNYTYIYNAEEYEWERTE